MKHSFLFCCQTTHRLTIYEVLLFCEQELNTEVIELEEQIADVQTKIQELNKAQLSSNVGILQKDLESVLIR